MGMQKKKKKYEKAETSVLIFLHFFMSVYMKFSMQPQPVGLLKLVLILFCTI